MSQSTEIEPAFIERGRIVMRRPDATLEQIAEAVIEDVPIERIAPDAIPFPDPAPVINITEEQRAALRTLGEVFGKVQPGTRRALDDDELASLYHEREVLKIIGEAVGKREEYIKTTIRHHLDVTAEEAGIAVPKAVIDPETGRTIVEPTPRDEHGHYILAAKGEPERANIKGTNQAWSREYRAGGKATTVVDIAALEQMRREGAIDNEDWLAMTKQVRVIDPDKIKEALRDAPRRLAILRAITKRTIPSPGTSLFVRKAK